MATGLGFASARRRECSNSFRKANKMASQEPQHISYHYGIDYMPILSQWVPLDRINVDLTGLGVGGRWGGITCTALSGFVPGAGEGFILHTHCSHCSPGAGRVGCWSPAEGYARRRWRQQENRAESAQSGGGRALGMGRWGWRTGWGVGPQTGPALTSDHPTKNCLGLEQNTRGSETLCHFLTHTWRPCSPDGFNHWRKKAALLGCMKNRSWESLGKAACTACLPSN